METIKFHIDFKDIFSPIETKHTDKTKEEFLECERTSTNLSFSNPGKINIFMKDIKDSFCLVFILDNETFFQDYIIEYNIRTFINFYVKALGTIHI